MREIKMGMTKEQFAGMMDIFDGAYPRKNYTEEKVLRVWYKFFGKYDPDVFQSVVDNWIINNSAAPTIADLKPSLNKNQVHKYREMERDDGVPFGTYIDGNEWSGK